MHRPAPPTARQVGAEVACLTLTSAAKVPMVESYLSRWEACLTPPLSLTHTTSRLEAAPRPSQQRRNWRPMRPKPLMATRIFLAETVTCLLPARACRRETGASAAAAVGGVSAGGRAGAHIHRPCTRPFQLVVRATNGLLRADWIAAGRRVACVWQWQGIGRATPRAATHSGGGGSHAAVEIGLGACQQHVVGLHAGELAEAGLQAGGGRVRWDRRPAPPRRGWRRKAAIFGMCWCDPKAERRALGLQAPAAGGRGSQRLQAPLQSRPRAAASTNCLDVQFWVAGHCGGWLRAAHCRGLTLRAATGAFTADRAAAMLG